MRLSTCHLAGAGHDACPFVLSPEVIEKLAFMHRVVHHSRPA